MHSKITFPELYSCLRNRFGFLDWWPGDTPDEIIIGAILTQNASWKNVEKAISNLKDAGCLSLSSIKKINTKMLEAYIRPSGFFRQKSRRLKIFANYVLSNYDSLDVMFMKPVSALRSELLCLHGIGRETADSIILYAAEKPVFVIDAYTKRITCRIYDNKKEPEYDELQRIISSGIKRNLGLYQDFHAQFVELGKNYCRTEPLCSKCPVRKYCLFGARSDKSK
ncbi:hypothetical protein M1590_00430 [Candidatus Marsarchaeota archaeon]|nr:hypothetical protein [Candidatus Marsarchaeota archaeon]